MQEDDEGEALSESREAYNARQGIETSSVRSDSCPKEISLDESREPSDKEIAKYLGDYKAGDVDNQHNEFQAYKAMDSEEEELEDVFHPKSPEIGDGEDELDNKEESEFESFGN